MIIYDSIMYKGVWWSQTKQRIRYTSKHSFEDVKNYDYVGSLTQVEFDTFIEILFVRYQDTYISLDEISNIYDQYRNFLNRLKDITDKL